MPIGQTPTPDEPIEKDHSTETVIEASGLAKAYDSLIPFGRSVDVLENASLRVKRGQIVGVMGENGSGKSTLMNILAGVLDPDAGTVERAGRIGWCPQEPRLYERLTVDETFSLFGRGYDMTETEIDEAREWLLDVLDFERFRSRQVRHLSGGNRQKLNLAVALMHEPDLLLLDEPYTGFDWETFLAFWELADELRERGVGIAVISHIINEHDRFDVVYELRDGELNRRSMDNGEHPATEAEFPVESVDTPQGSSTTVDSAGTGSSQTRGDRD